MSIVDWKNEFQSKEIPKVSKRDKKLMFASLSCREREEKEIRACIQTTYEQCLTICEKGTNFIEEFDYHVPSH